MPRQEVADGLAGILSYKGIVSEDRNRLAASLRFFQKENIDIVDAIVQVTAAQRGFNLVTFDKDLRRLHQG